MQNLARLRLFLGNPAGAESLFEEALNFLRRDPGFENKNTAATLDELGESQFRQKKSTEAERSFRESSKIYSKIAPNTWQRSHAQARLGYALLGQKKYDEAEKELLEGYEGLKTRETTNPEYAAVQLQRVVGWLVELYEALGDRDKADQWRGRRSDRLSPDSKETSR